MGTNRQVPQPLGKKPELSVKNMHMASHGNTKSTGGEKPSGKPHAKIATGSKDMGVGKYL